MNDAHMFVALFLSITWLEKIWRLLWNLGRGWYSAIRDIIVQQLKSLAYSKIQVATNGEEALRLLQVITPKLIITDWSMPVMNGLELLQAVRRDPRLSAIPVVIVSAEMQRDYVRRDTGGVTDFLFKPFKTRWVSTQSA